MKKIDEPFARITKRILTALADAPLSTTERKVIDYVILHTYGANGSPKSAPMPVAKIASARRVSEAHAARVVAYLVTAKVLTEYAPTSRAASRDLGLNKNPDQWRIGEALAAKKAARRREQRGLFEARRHRAGATASLPRVQPPVSPGCNRQSPPGATASLTNTTPGNATSRHDTVSSDSARRVLRARPTETTTRQLQTTAADDAHARDCAAAAAKIFMKIRKLPPDDATALAREAFVAFGAAAETFALHCVGECSAGIVDEPRSWIGNAINNGWTRPRAKQARARKASWNDLVAAELASLKEVTT